jgi:hypothetical protein
MKRRTTSLLQFAIVLAGLAVSPVATAGEVPAARLEAPVLPVFDTGVSIAGRTLTSAAAPRRLADSSWWGGTYTVAGGQTVSVFVSTTYPDNQALGQKWADFFAALPHGAELPLLRAYIAPLDEVQDMCWSADVVGCYGGQKLVTVGDSSAGIPPASVAAHEYGHHIAANRSNAPWSALDWGTKRWASYVGVCSRVKAGTAYPGDEGANYSFNPGEAFAESYRVLIETNGSAVGYDWPIVDPSFRPTVDGLAPIREDVLQPWSAPTATTLHAAFLRRGRTWTKTVSTPLDGDLRVRVSVPGDGADDVKLLSSDGKTVLASGSWDSSGSKSVQYRVCGQRSLKVRVIRGGAAARFTLRVSLP